MEKTFAKVDELADHVKAYMNNRIDAVKLNTAEKGSKLAANALSMISVLLVFGLCLVFASFALAFVLAKLTGEIYWGFLIVAGIYLLLGAGIWVLREKLLKLPIQNALLKQIFKEEDEKD